MSGEELDLPPTSVYEFLVAMSEEACKHPHEQDVSQIGAWASQALWMLNEEREDRKNPYWSDFTPLLSRLWFAVQMAESQAKNEAHVGNYHGAARWRDQGIAWRFAHEWAADVANRGEVSS